MVDGRIVQQADRSLKEIGWEIFRPVLFGAAFAALTFWLQKGVATSLISEVFAWASGAAAAAWALAFYGFGKLSELTELPALYARQHSRVEVLVARYTRRLWGQGALLAVSALASALPALLLQSQTSVPEYVFWIAGAALGVVLSCVLRSYFLIEHVRKFKSEMRQQDRREAARREQLKTLTPGN